MYRSIALVVIALTFAASQDPPPPPEDIDIPLPSNGNEWILESNDRMVSAGIRHLRMQDIFLDPNGNPQDSSDFTRVTKPSLLTFAIVVNPGSNCEGGIYITEKWSLTQKRAEDIPGAAQNFLYFIQDSSQWPSNEAGFLYGYDESNCPEREFSARIITEESQPDFVNAVINARNVRND